jgi:hypothetical protein
MSTLAERLNKVIEEKEEKIQELQDEASNLRHRLEVAGEFPQAPSPRDTEKMEVPRLEMVYIPSKRQGWGDYLVIQRLVYQHFLGHLDWCGIDWTRVSPGRSDQDGPAQYDGKVDLPFRSGAHLHANSVLLKMPAYTVIEPKSIIARVSMSKDPSFVDQLDRHRAEHLRE